MTEPIILTLPATPPSALSQNARKGWRAQLQVKNAWKEVAATAATVARCNDGAALDPARGYTVDIAVSWEKGHKLVDDDNLIASIKYARDAIAAVFEIDDKRFITGAITQSRDKNGIGYTVVTLTERPS